ncbi:MAG TPA: AAA family ATPase [Kribbella sp.]|nr:AAA family ATPase [Kribbella sp.]
MLYGRATEKQAIEQLIADARRGESGLLVLRGDVGVGKSALLDHAAGCGHGMLVLRGYGVQSEAELPFAALHQLLRPLLSRVDALPGPQAAALRSAFGLISLQPADRLQVALGALTLLSEAAEEQPVLCLVDDGQWLDQPSVDTLWFVANRLVSEPISMLLALRSGTVDLFPGTTELPLTGLDVDDAVALLADRYPELSAEVRLRVIAETSANPLALSELPTALTPQQRAGVEPLVGPLPLPDCIQQHYIKQLSHLPQDTRKLLHAAAAEDTGELAVVLRALQQDGIGTQALAVAESSGMVRVEDTLGGARVVFRHPLLRAAIYRTATLDERVRVHRALARALDPELDPDRRAWHLAASATGPDDIVAAELERNGLRALQRGAPSTAATAIEKAAWLTVSAPERARRLTAAASAANAAGQPVRAESLADQAEQLSSDVVVKARIHHLRAAMAFDRGSPVATHRLLVDGSAAVVADEPDLAAAMLVDAVKNAWFTNDRRKAAEATKALSAIRLAQRSPQRHLVRTVLRLASQLEALSGNRPFSSSPYAEIEPEPVAAGNGPREPLELVLRAVASMSLADDDAALAAAETAVQVCRTQGRLDMLVLALQVLATAEMLMGRHRFAGANATEGLELAKALGQDNRSCHFRAVLAWLDAVAGRADSCREQVTAALGHAEAQRIAPVVAIGRWALALLDLGLGHPERTLDQSVFRAGGSSEHPLVTVLRTPDLVEAAARTGRGSEVKRHLDQLSAWTADSGRQWARAVETRCRALLTSDETLADQLYRQALELHDEVDQSGQPRPFDRARTQLLYGEWLRRQRRRTDARVPLQAALDTFEQLGATPWAQRADSELRAAGSSVRTSVQAPAAGLTPQELQVVRLAREGASNREIGAQLFLSPRTVGYHLQKTFRKLGIRSRVELAQVMIGDEG